MALKKAMQVINRAQIRRRPMRLRRQAINRIQNRKAVRVSNSWQGKQAILMPGFRIHDLPSHGSLGRG